MAMQRGKKLTKLELSELNNIAQERGHLVLNVDKSKRNPSHVPKQSRVFLHCNKCNHEWDTKVYVYLERKSLSLGCRKCYENNIKNPMLYPNSPTRKKETTPAQPQRRAGRDVLHAAFVNGPFGHIHSVKDLISYFKENSNAYNDKALQLVLRHEGLKKQKRKLEEFFPNKVSYHHIIPLHAKGSPARWNIIPVTKEEHYELHDLRFKVYGEKADLFATYATQSDVIKADTGDFKKLKQPKPNTIGIRNLPEEIRIALQRGMVLTHKDGFHCEIKPNTLQTTQEIKNALLECLPDEHFDKKRILQNKTSINYIRALIITAFPVCSSGEIKESRLTPSRRSLSGVAAKPKRPVHSAYGFTLVA